MKRTQLVSAALSLTFLATVFAGPGFAVILDNGAAGYSETGSWVDSDAPGHPRAVNDSYRASNVGGATASYAPGLSGQYFVQVHWGLHPAHSAFSQYTVNSETGPQSYTVSQKQSAAQGTSGSFVAGTDFPIEGSGWYSLGGNGTLFTLNPSSNVTLTRTSGSDHIIADAVRFSTDFVADERAAVVAGPWSSIATATASGGEESTQYLRSSSISATVTYRPGVAGLFDLAASWGVESGNTTAAQYLLDLDGNLGTTGDQSMVAINQKLLSNQVTAGIDTDWSGYRPLFSTMLTTDSIVLLTNAAGSGNLSADGLLLTPIELVQVPEPSALLLVGLGLVALSLKSRRRPRGIAG